MVESRGHDNSSDGSVDGSPSTSPWALPLRSAARASWMDTPSSDLRLDDDGLLAEIELRVDRLEVLLKCNVRWRGDAARFRNRRADLQRQRLRDDFERSGCKQQRYCRVHGRRRALARF